MSDDVEKKLGYIGARLREKSTYGGLAVAIGVVLPWLISKFPELAGADSNSIASAIASMGIGVGTLICIFLPEKGPKAVIAFLMTAIALTLVVPGARAASLTQPSSAAAALKNVLANPYTLTACGGYFGVNTIGSTNSVSGDVAPGTQVVQGGIGGTVGYGCPINASTGSFWFAEVMADIENLNGASNGLSLSGPAQFTERFGAGTPLNQFLGSILPSGTNGPAVPSLPILPSGVTAGPGAPYAYVALHQKDISLSNGLSSNREWLLSWGVGLGLRYRLSNGVVADTFAEYDANTQSICVGPLGGSACAKPGQGAQVGLAFLY